MKIAIAAATGNIGTRVAQIISENREISLLLGKDKEQLEKQKTSYAIPVPTDISKPDEVIANTKEVDALLWLVPPVVHVPSIKEWYDQVIKAGTKTVKHNNIKRVVLISSLGAGYKQKTGTVGYVGNMEREFDKVTTNMVSIRPGYFMENFLLQKDNIIGNDVISFPYDEDHDIPFISSDDIADAAAHYLMDDTWSGRWVKNLMGPANLTLTEATQIFSEKLKKKITYNKQQYADIKTQFEAFGANENVQQEMVDLFKALGDKDGIYATPRTYEAYTSTTLEDFIENKFLA